MKVTPSTIPGVLLIEPKVFGDERGFFFESFNQKTFNAATGLDVNFVQDNHSRSTKGVLRGMHYQVQQPQGKLVRVVRGAVFDVVVDLRQHSPTFGKWEGVQLTEENHLIRWIPSGFAHGFLVQSDWADFLYRSTDFYAPQHERSIRWNDESLAIAWPLTGLSPTLSSKDAAASGFHEEQDLQFQKLA